MLLLDEPFSALDSALDPELREHTRTELDDLLKRLDFPAVTMAHDPEYLAWFGEQALDHVARWAAFLCDNPYTENL